MKKTIFFHSKCGISALYAALYLSGKLGSLHDGELPRLMGQINSPGRSLVFESAELKAISFCSSGTVKVVHNIGLSLVDILKHKSLLHIVHVQEASLCTFRAWLFCRAPTMMRSLIFAEDKRGREAADACIL